jgi:polar amino acid transport system substrate-binding protein
MNYGRAVSALALASMCLAWATVTQAQSVAAADKTQVAPTGELRAALVTIPFLAKADAAGVLKGVAPDLAAEMARRLEIPYRPTRYDTPNAGIKALREGQADITFLAPTPERVGLIDFGPAFMTMQMTLLVPTASSINTQADADQPGRRIVAYERTAVEEMLRKKMTKATIVTVPIFGYKQAFELLKSGQADAFADLRDALMSYQAEFVESRIVLGNYGWNELAIGYAKDRPIAEFVKQFTWSLTSSGFVTRAIEKAGINGAVAPPY